MNYSQANDNNTLNDRVSSLPGIGTLETAQFAGYVPIVPKDKITPESESLFYWFVGAEDYANKPTVIWTNGGPGSSSFWGFFLENGPYEITSANGPTAEVKPRPWAWNNKVNYMIFEHPLSVTLSFAKSDDDVPKTAKQGAQEYYNALQNFLDKHPDIRKNKIILAGESYAGTYLPLIANAICTGNTYKESHIDLANVVLLDAWVAPEIQMSKDTEYAYNHGLISKKQKKYFDKTYTGKKLNNLDWNIHKLTGVYMTNIAKTGDPSFQPVYDYINRDDVRAAIHIAPGSPKITQNWSKTVSANYLPEVNTSYVSLVDYLLEGGVTIQVINGLNDAKDCNFLGTEAWLETLKSKAAKQYQKADQERWNDPQGHTIGFQQDGGQLSWVKVLNAGHMAVGDQPLILDIILEKSGCASFI